MLWLGARKDYKEIQENISIFGGNMMTYMEIVSCVGPIVLVIPLILIISRIAIIMFYYDFITIV